MCVNNFYEEIIYILTYIESLQVIDPLMVSVSLGLFLNLSSALLLDSLSNFTFS